ncbi:flavodoxin family protein [Ornithinibacillus salinisoli]|uniref:Flavodoxin family protein n=1 Tax=Ornithinibacillus salinisoli TaxID=1848459 RepID=A0ABW4VUJ4_9BACI
MRIMALLGSSRRNGNTEYLTNKVLDGVNHQTIYLLDKKIDPIVDERHTDEGFSYVEDDYEELFFEFLKHDTIVFATPSYWFGMSGQMKIFFDRWSQYMRDHRFDFKEEMRKKKAYVIVAGNKPDPKIAALPLIQQFNYIFEYVGMEFVDYIIGNGNKPEDILTDTEAIAKAKLWNDQLKTK